MTTQTQTLYKPGFQVSRKHDYLYGENFIFLLFCVSKLLCCLERIITYVYLIFLYL